MANNLTVTITEVNKMPCIHKQDRAMTL